MTPATASRAVVAVLIVLFASACSDRAEAPRGTADGPCLDGEQQAALIAQRLVAGVTGLGAAQAVALDPPLDNYFYVVAAAVEAPDEEGRVGVWGTGSWLGGARVMALDDNARRWSDWGTAISSHSPAGRQRSRLAARREVDRAQACLAGYLSPR